MTTNDINDTTDRRSEYLPIDRMLPSVNLRPRLGVKIINRQSTCPLKSPLPDLWPSKAQLSCASSVNLPDSVMSTSPNISACRQDRIVDWPQFKLRRRPPTSFCSSTPHLKERVPCRQAGSRTQQQQQPIRALHLVGEAGLHQKDVRRSRIRRGSQLSHKWNSPSAVQNLLASSSDLNASSTSVLCRQHSLTPSQSTNASPVPRRGISTNPHIRRRYSADGTLLPNEEAITPSPAKRPNSGDNPTRVTEWSPLCVRPLLVGPPQSLGCTSTSISTRRLSMPLECEEVKQTSSLANDVVGNRALFRSSTGTVTRLERNLSEESPSVRPRPGSDLFLGIRRSARQTLDNLRRVLRSSNSLLLLSKTPKSTEIQLRQRRRMSRFNSLQDRFRFEEDCNSVPEDRLKPDRVEVEITRSDLSEPFGLFVVQSKNGFLITRISQHLSRMQPIRKGHLSDAASLRVGDEIVEINHHLASTLSLNHLSSLLATEKRVCLTIKFGIDKSV